MWIALLFVVCTPPNPVRRRDFAKFIINEIFESSSFSSVVQRGFLKFNQFSVIFETFSGVENLLIFGKTIEPRMKIMIKIESKSNCFSLILKRFGYKLGMQFDTIYACVQHNTGKN